MKLAQLIPEGCEVRDRVVRHTVAHAPFARLDRESRLRLHALLREAIDGDGLSPTAEAPHLERDHGEERP